MSKSLDLTDIIYRTSIINPDDVKPLIEYLDMEESRLSFEQGDLRKTAKTIASQLREMGSNDFATFFRREGVGYREVVLDVAKKIGASGASDANSVEENENVILEKLFQDALDKMSDEEKRELFSSMGFNEKEIPFASGSSAVISFLLKRYGGFGVYRMSVVVANMVAKALLGRGLSFAANAAITRTVGTLLGPIGWIASGAWLAIDLAGPAYRKTVPAVVHIAMLRQMLVNRITIGVVGDGSSGKDALVKAVFGLDTGNVHPVSGSTQNAVMYDLEDTGAIRLVNYPGFNDVRSEVNSQTTDMLHYTDVFILVVDILRGVSKTDVDILSRVSAFSDHVLICLNKVDLPRPEDKHKLLEAAHDRLQGKPILETAFDPDERLGFSLPVNSSAVHDWVTQHLKAQGKEISRIPKGNFE